MTHLSQSDLLFSDPQPSNGGWGGELCAPPSAFAVGASQPPPRTLQPGSYTFGPMSAAPSYAQPGLQPGHAGLQGLGSAGLVDACAMQALTEELLGDARGFGNIRTAGGWAIKGPVHGSTSALRALMPPPAAPQPVPEELVRRTGSTSTVSTCWGPTAAAGWLERQCASEGSAPKRDLHLTRSGPAEPLQLTSAAPSKPCTFEQEHIFMLPHSLFRF